MEYITVTYKVPQGFENQFDQLVERKIEAILSQQMLTPTAKQVSDFDKELLKAKQEYKP